jgi:hypothetical protein
MTFSRHVAVGTTRALWNVRLMPSLVLTYGLRLVISVSENVNAPSLADSKPLTTLKKVLLPEPFGPINP